MIVGVLILSVNLRQVAEHRIASASAKFAELKHMLQDQRINLKTQSLYMNAFIRSRLFFNFFINQVLHVELTK